MGVKMKWIGCLIFGLVLQLHAQPVDNLRFVHFTNQDGLPSSYIKDLAQDRFGFVWISNRENVCRYDGYSFQPFPALDAADQPFELRANTLHQIGDTLLFARAINGEYYYFDDEKEQFRYFTALNELGVETQSKETSIGLWYLKAGQLFLYDFKQNKSMPYWEVFAVSAPALSSVQAFDFRDKRLAFIAVTEEGEDQIFYLQQGKIERFDPPFLGISLVFLDSHENIWLGQDQSGLCRLEPKHNRTEIYNRQAKGNLQLVHNYVHIMEEDHDGVIWIGTEGGLNRWKPQQRIISKSQHSLDNPDGLSSDPIYSILCDQDQNVWLGTYFSGINLWNRHDSFFKTLSAGTGDLYLGGSAVSSFAEDREGNVWIGLEDMGINKLDAKSGRITKYPVGEAKGGLSYGNVHALYFEDAQHLWVATYTGGINILNVGTGKFTYVNTENTPGLVSDDIYSFEEIGDSVFISTSGGISLYLKSTGRFQPFHTESFRNVWVESMTQTPGKIWFSSRAQIFTYDLKTQLVEPFILTKDYQGVNFIKADSKNRVWIGDSFLGLCFYDTRNGKFKQFTKENGFPGSWIYNLQEGMNDWFWVGTDEGLVKVDPETGASFLYNRDSGIPFNQFNYRSAFRDSRGVIYLGSNEGLIYFDENKQSIADRSGDVVLTGFKLFNQTIAPGGEDAILDRSVTLAKEVELEYEQNVFTIDFSALNFLNQGKCHYAYYLDGFETEYNFVGNRNFATYTNLNPGTYTFKVIASFDNASWEKTPTTLRVVIHPPFWMSGLGYALWFFILLMILILIALVTTNIQKSKAQALLERRERVHAVQLNQLKLEFFTNISHELRTPLTLIVGPLSRLMNNEKVSPFVKDSLTGINLNAHRLLQLLNQLLEFRKIEQGKEGLQVCQAEISGLFDNLKQSFELTAEEHQLDLQFDSTQAKDPVWFDPSKVEKILINLISNSFKFTDSGGSITVKAKIKEKSGGRKILHLTVRDTGKGMESRVVNKIFDRFYQSETADNKAKEFYGTGIGLSFVHSLVQLHRGKVWVKSKVNVGTIFKIDLPVAQSDYQAAEIISGDYTERLSTHPVVTAVSKKPEETTQNDEDAADKPKILLVEDNEELIEFVAGALSETYAIIKATNGAEGLEKLENHTIDLILCDVMMPVMDGFEFTRRVKTDIETSHIPVILLTAKSGSENKFEGLKTGADFYIEKPFLAHILEQNIRNVLSTRRNLIKKYKRDAFMPATELTHSESDKKFIDQLTQIIKDNITKTDMDVTFLTTEAGLSRTMLHLKLKKLADCSATEFINTIRLKEAVKLMAEEQCNVSEAAYRTGFSSPTYFTRRFKQYYGQSPKDFIQQEKGN